MKSEGALAVFSRLCVGATPEELLGGCARLYCEIWKEPPWSEDFWQPEEVKSDLLAQLAKPGAAGFMATSQGAVAGFTWGYAITEKELNKISGIASLKPLFGAGEKLFYVDELAVGLAWRRAGIGRGLSLRLLEAALAGGIQHAILRTDEKAVAARNLYRQLGFRELAMRDAKYQGRTYWLL